ncbi:MAG: hypothetical protein ACK5H4_16450 [Lacrimispora sphenoides]
MSKKDDNEKSYMVLGMCFGMMVGAVAMCFSIIFGHIIFGVMCLGFGYMAGMLVGMCIKKKN